MPPFDLHAVPSPCWVIDLAALERNARLLATVADRTGCRILLALKGYAAWATFPLLRRFLHGVCASSVFEARLGREEFGREVHAYAPAYSAADIATHLELVDHLVFNAPDQYRRYAAQVTASGVSPGLRVNPGHSEVAVPLYDPCIPGSRLGTPRAALGDALPEGIEGLHFHALCEQGADVLGRVLGRFEADFANFLPALRWVNCGGGHHITRDDYDVDGLVRLLDAFRSRHPHLQLYLEPGEAVALNAGVLVSEVLDLVHWHDRAIAILDTSAACHMPDVLEMPYRPDIVGAGAAGATAHTYRLGGLSCLAGDVIGDYSFDRPLAVGDRLCFTDMAHYTMVKTTTFNGVRLPAIALYDAAAGSLEVVHRFGYDDFKNRLS